MNLDDLLPEIHDRRLRTLRAGLTNPSEEIREMCAKALREAEEGHGGE